MPAVRTARGVVAVQLGRRVWMIRLPRSRQGA